MLDMNFCAACYQGGPSPWWTTRDSMGNWVVVCNLDYDGPRNRPSSPTYPANFCSCCGAIRSRRWYTISGPLFPPMPDRTVCEECRPKYQ